MDDNQSSSGGDRAVVSTRTVEIAVALVLFTLGAIVVFDSYRLGSKWSSDGPQSGYFPFYIGLLICFSSLITLALAAFGKLAKPAASEPFVLWGPFKLVLTVLFPAALYVLAIKYVGLYVASALYIAVFMVERHCRGTRRQRHFFSDVRSLVQGAVVQGRAQPTRVSRVLTMRLPHGLFLMGTRRRICSN